MIRWLSIGVITYMILGIFWWGLLIYQKEEALYQYQLESATADKSLLNKNHARQTSMIIGEGLVLGLSLLVGIYIINRSARKEIENAQQQSDFLLSVSHELKSPIAAIQLALQTLRRKGLPQEKQAQFIDSALRDTKRLESLVQNILVSTNISSSVLEVHKAPIDANNLITNVVNKLEHSRDIQIEKFAAPLIINADTLFLSQAMNNLIDNAIKYSLDQSTININLGRMDNNCVLTIGNKGPQITEKEKENIFKKFYRGKSQNIRKKEGTGIGLYIAKKIIEQHEGNIEYVFQNDLNTFKISIPLHDK